MDPASATHVHDDQQVMTAQTAQPTPRHAGQLLMEGEVAGPDYDGARRPRPAVSLPLPNGVPSTAVQRPPVDGVELDSLNGSPWAAGMAHADTSVFAYYVFVGFETWGVSEDACLPHLSIDVVYLPISFLSPVEMDREGKLTLRYLDRELVG
ncbi:unnamed protein product [Symbiodinium sp. CCMP2592]|nr:unnamed protein product [Symbiodinium sp. CCMP2592]